MNSDELNQKERAWLEYRAEVYRRFQESLSEGQKTMLAEYVRAGQELTRIQTWRKHKPNAAKKSPKVVPWPPE